MRGTTGRSLALLGACALLTACSSGGSGGTSASAASSAPSSPASSSTTSSAPVAASSTGAPTGPTTGAGSGTAAPGGPSTIVDPPRPTAPAATTAGSLSEHSLPSPSGWATTKGDGADGAYIPNGTWVDARDARSTANEMLGLGCRDVPSGYPVPRAALEGTYAGPGGAPGTTEALEFADEASARRFVEVYRQQGRACGQGGGTTYAELRTSPALVDRRHVEGDPTPWLEVVGVKGRQATFLMLQEKAGSLTDAQVDALVHDLT